MVHYENQRVFFDKIRRMYRDYLILYRFLNHGSTNGCTPFADFYWMHSYYYRHSGLANKFGRI